eukprot:TRINITY_DN18142_c0_g1_i1.p1 TRINITY_DN18142_c0_g1~~TRINITY_DN18142_c0_g1_i1.p1  ORF type:complete len:278 (-),score=44.15 TRINITY_DN18142_c0_g1_i1:27-833(-)
MMDILRFLHCCSSNSDTKEIIQMPVWGHHASPAEGGASPEDNREFMPAEVVEVTVPVDEPRTPAPFLSCCANTCQGKLRTISRGRVYLVELDRSRGAELGVSLDVNESRYCLIAHIDRGGLVSNWNRDRPAADSVRVGDRLLFVDDYKGIDCRDLAQRLSAEKRLSLTLQHPEIITVALTRNGRSLGITVSPPQTAGHSSVGVVITEVQDDGAVGHWNADNDHKLRPGARIVEVNCERRHAKMVEELKTREMLQLKVIDWPDPNSTPT